MKLLPGFIAIVGTACFLAGCAESDSGDVQESADDGVILVKDDDPEMAAAVKEAQNSVDEFIKALENPSATTTDFAVKKEFKDGDTSEFMWLTDVTYQDGKFTGTLNNDPGLVKNAVPGQSYSVARGEGQDWVYFEGEDMKGGFSVKLLMERSQQ